MATDLSNAEILERPLDASAALVEAMLRAIGEDPTRDGLKDTPKRVIKAMAELTSGYDQDPAEFLNVQFDEHSDEMIVVRNIPFYSLCEHHCLPFHGVATIGYIPAKSVVGLSKLPRLLHCFARRLQIQERLTRQITDAIDKHVQPLGAACVLRATHTCMLMRGVKSSGEMVTSSLTGRFREISETRNEFLKLANQG